MSQNETRRPPERPASLTTCTDVTNDVGQIDYPRCESCGDRFPAPEFLERHRMRACIGPVGERRVVMVRRGRRGLRS